MLANSFIDGTKYLIQYSLRDKEFISAYALHIPSIVTGKTGQERDSWQSQSLRRTACSHLCG